MPKLILHIGLHKTGSTCIQNYLDMDRESLRNWGVLYPKTGYSDLRPYGGRILTSSGHDGFVRGALNRKYGRSLVSELHEELERSECHTALISAENLTHHLVGNMAPNVRQLFASFQETKVIIILRNHIDFLESYYRELVTNGWAFERANEEKFYRKYGRRILNFAARIQEWALCFGEHNIKVGIYGSATDGGLVKNFFDLAGLQEYPLKEEIPRRLDNARLPIMSVIALREFNGSILPSRIARDAINSNLEMLLNVPEKTKFHALSRNTVNCINELAMKDLPRLRGYLKQAEITKLLKSNALSMRSIDELSAGEIIQSRHIALKIKKSMNVGSANSNIAYYVLGTIRVMVSLMPNWIQLMCKRISLKLWDFGLVEFK